MAAATNVRSTAGARTGASIRAAVKGGVQIFAGTIVFCDPADGFAKPATATAAQRCLGIASETVDNRTGADGAAFIEIFVSHGAEGVKEWPFGINQADKLLAKDIGAVCYALDDSTVTATAAGKTAVGTVVQLTNDGLTAYVRFAL